MASTNLKRKFAEGITFINDSISSGGKVLVHCFAGVSRSATMVIAYMMQEHSMSYHSAMKFVKSKRAFINPNDGFRTQLIHFGKEL
jgi:protein-tyrosine phosphatase